VDSGDWIHFFFILDRVEFDLTVRNIPIGLMVDSTQPGNLSALKAEISHFREELNTRDQLVQQLSQELFRIVKTNHSQPPRGELVGDYKGEIRALREQLQGVETQVQYYQDQLQTRDAEIQQLRRTVRELSDRSRMLEQVVQELPKIYTQKFAERLAPIRDKIAKLHQENQRLQTELQQASDRSTERSAAAKSSRLEIDLPELPRSAAFSS
jgi:chromosome segregation ATPase